MDGVLFDLIKTSPALGVLAFVVWIFLGYMERRDKANAQVSERVVTALDRNTEMFGRVVSVVERAEKPKTEN